MDQKSVSAYVAEVAKLLNVTRKIAVKRIKQALFVEEHLTGISFDEALTFFAFPEPTFEKKGEWFTDWKTLSYGISGMTPNLKPRDVVSVTRAVVANMYELCYSPKEVFATFFQAPDKQLAVWRLAHIWEEQQKKKK